MAGLLDIPVQELVRATQNTRVRGVSIGLDEQGRAAVMKFSFNVRPMATFCFAPPIVLLLAEKIADVAKIKSWAPIEPKEQPTFTDDDWNCADKNVLRWRVEVFDDALIAALQISEQEVQVVRFRPGHAAWIAQRLLDSETRARLRDIRDDSPRSTRRH